MLIINKEAIKKTIKLLLKLVNEIKKILYIIFDSKYVFNNINMK
jgi:hypothetical protein